MYSVWIGLFLLLHFDFGRLTNEDGDYEPNFNRLPVPVTADISCQKKDCTRDAWCLDCTFPECDYGATVNVNCTTKPQCNIQQTVTKEAVCSYCYQTPEWEQDCESLRGNCSVTSAPPKNLLRSVCKVKPHLVCIGRRTFYKRVRCNWTNGYKWSTAMLLSVTLGGFGVDRFYLGLWKSGIGKLFSFGGLGIWTLLDVVLIATGYIGPADGSLYM